MTVPPFPRTPPPWLERLIALLPAETVDRTAEGRYRASLDNLRLSHLPEVVVRPQTEDQVGAVLRLANLDRVPVVARGAGSATTGTTVPIRGGIVLDLSGWKAVEVDPLSMVAYAQPGATVESVDLAARQHGLFFPPDPGSKAHATIGGAVATNAGGLRGAKYGVMRDYVLALEGFLPTGDFVRWGADLRKFAAGYNLRDLWVGSEGTLGVITGAVLRLIPAPEHRATLLAGFADEGTALEAVRDILSQRLMPSILEFLDRQTTACTRDLLKAKGEAHPLLMPYLEPPQALLLVEFDGMAAQVGTQMKRLEELLAPRAGAVATALDQEAEGLWTIRRRCSQAMFQLATHKLNEDIVVPIRAQMELLAYTLELKERTGLATPTFGHAADGNFHVHIMYNMADEDQRQRAQQAVQELMEKVVALGGAITGEHGIGLAKSPFLHLQHGAAEIGAMRAIKHALDPNGILNPGKIFEPFEVWNHPREQVHLPWDH